jgi:DNA repair protein SbcC/Rad50
VVIKRLNIEGYGKLSNLTINFNDGVNMIFGMNEAGKTTLKRCILSLLYGQKEAGRSIGRHNEREQMKPWDGSPYKASITYALKNGRTFTVVRDFEDGTVKVIDVGTGKNFTANYPVDENGEPMFAKEQFGIDCKSFAASAVIEHQSFQGYDDVEMLSASILNVADSASMQHTYLSVIERLKKTLDVLGNENDRSTPIGKITAEIEALRKSGMSDQDKQKTIDMMKMSLEQILSEKKQTETDLVRWTFIGNKIDLDKVTKNISELEKLEEEIPPLEKEIKEITGGDAISLSNLTELYSLHSEKEKTQKLLNKAEEQYSQLQAEAENVNRLLQSKQKFLEIDAQVLELIDISSSSEIKESVIQTKEKMLEQARTKEEAAKEQFEAEYKLFSDFQNAEDYDMYVSDLAVKLNKQDMKKLKESDLDRLGGDIKNIKKRMIQRFISALILVIAGSSAVFYGFFPNILTGSFSVNISGLFISIGIIPLVVGVLIWLSTFSLKKDLETAEHKYGNRKKEVDLLASEVEKAQTELKKLFKRIGVLSVEELRKRYREFSRIKIDLETSGQLVKTLEEELEKLYMESSNSPGLRKYLQESGYVKESEPVTSELISKFKRDYKEAKSLQEQSSHLEKELIRQENEIKQLKEEVIKLRIELDRILHNGNVDSIEDYDKAYRRIMQADKLRAQFQSLLEKRELLSSGTTLAELKSFKAQIETRLTEVLQINPEYANIKINETSAEKTTQTINYLQQKINELNTKIVELQSRIEAFEAESMSEAKKTEMTERRNERKELMKHKVAIEQAISVIYQTGQEFQKLHLVPGLSKTTAQILHRITGKYNDVIIDKNMNIMVKDSEKSQTARPENLSGAAMDQLYFSLRLGIARTFSTGRENLPLLMDDPFMYFDETRRDLAFDTILGVEKAHQVLFFTCSSLQKKYFARALKEKRKLAKLYNIKELQLIVPANAKPVDIAPVPQAPRKEPAGTSFLKLPEGFELPKLSNE